MPPDLTQAYTDEEASPPEWVDILAELNERVPAVERRIAEEAERFAADPDIRTALARRESVSTAIREEILTLNERIRRLNLIAPRSRVQRAELDPVGLLRPLFRAERATRPPDPR